MTTADKLRDVQKNITRACQLANRDPHTVKLLAVSKYMPDKAVQELHSLGITAFGENKIQNARQRMAEFPDVEWHFIGSLQTNKVRYCKDFDLIHSLDRWNLAESMNKKATRWHKKVDMLIQVNIALEDSKHGVVPDEVPDFALQVQAQCPMLRIRGLMAMAPWGNPEESRPYFKRLRELNEGLAKLTGWSMDTLSMGMSNDYEVAIAEGATLIRVGSALFNKEG